MKRFLYDIHTNGRYSGTMTAAEVEEMTGLDRNKVNAYAKKNALWKKTYKIIAIDPEEEATCEEKINMMPASFKDEWDRARKRVLIGLGGNA